MKPKQHPSDMPPAPFPPGDATPTLPYPALQTRRVGSLTLVIMDPDAYLKNPDYVAERRAGRPAIRNLWAFDQDGAKQWEAELPESSDYYYAFAADSDAIVVDSFSGYSCEISPTDGSIVRRVFYK
jgi:outer membrane protein assembly factor BamB